MCGEFFRRTSQVLNEEAPFGKGASVGVAALVMSSATPSPRGSKTRKRNSSKRGSLGRCSYSAKHNVAVVLVKHVWGAYDGAMVIGISGAQGSFSEEAARTYASKHAVRKSSLRYLISVENVLAALERGEIDLGIFPIENSNGGIVIEAVHAMAAHRFHIKRIFEIDVHHCLLVRRGVTADQVKTITSHDQAIKQCRMYLKRMWPKVKVREYADTAKAAEDLAGGRLPISTAVIASRAAAQRYKLDVLEESIQDLKFNFTSFIAATALPRRH